MRLRGHLAATTAAAIPLHINYLRNGHISFATTSTSSSTCTPFAFPVHRNPTPHQIFHLPSNASQPEIKARYYELARYFHPDSPVAQALSPSVRHARFHAITTAYDILRGRSHAHISYGSTDDAYAAELARRRRQHAWRQAYHSRAPPDSAEAGGSSDMDDAWKDQVIIVVGLASIVVGFAPALLSLHTIPNARHRAASANLAEARAAARTFGDERRAAIRARVAEFERKKGNDESLS
ncbi:hypothetical protein F5148DRAFT_1300683 [Russula earlei]|uniref:Uncharacterized protein n=1 Tax=Russula earlei TaxID=71964 RepID=A0ACC0U128_9AGAM|nr:hypothetical protein F5148DRAFT_1300683 [Russula earlei]